MHVSVIKRILMMMMMQDEGGNADQTDDWMEIYSGPFRTCVAGATFTLLLLPKRPNF